MGEKVQMEIYAGGLREILPLLVQPILGCDTHWETVRIFDFCLKNAVALQRLNYLPN